ncbi:hypothetical protein HY493_04610 [Candidatus Woesearchaeota archaeon]|nr:hypothetical protein [Candidatus Woesearchaeota archaeon]
MAYPALYEREIKGLNKAKVDYVIIGAIALGLQGFPRSTSDLDIVPKLTRPNLRRAIDVLLKLDYRPRLPVDPYDVADAKIRAYWFKEKNLRAFTLFRGPVDEIDLVIYPHLTYAECKAHAREVLISKTKVHVASLRDLLTMKKAANRPKDLYDILAIEALLRERQDG